MDLIAYLEQEPRSVSGVVWSGYRLPAKIGDPIKPKQTGSNLNGLVLQFGKEICSSYDSQIPISGEQKEIFLHYVYVIKPCTIVKPDLISRTQGMNLGITRNIKLI